MYFLRKGVCVSLSFLIASSFFFASTTTAQVNSVVFGRNRVQFKKQQWKYFQSKNFNIYFNQGGLELGKYVNQVAEFELPFIEDEVEYALQRKVNIIIYNNYNEYKASNIGLNTELPAAGGVTRLVNNKMVLYFDGNHDKLRIQIREGIARVLMDNMLFGEDIGEFASNQALLDLPPWLIDGYIAYIAEHWSAEKDDELKSTIMSGNYTKFYQFAFDKPLLAGHAFWYYISEKYKPADVTYFLYLARVYKNLNAASQKIAKKKFKDLLADFFEFQQTKYQNDIRQRRNAPKGQLTVVEEIKKGRDYFNFAANPNPRNNDYAMVEYRNGVYRVKLIEDFTDQRILLKYGVRTNLGDINPNYPILAWDNKGTKLLVIYWKEGKINMFVYDQVAKIKRFKQEITGFEQIVSAGFMLNANTLLMSAVKNGKTDIFIYDIEKEKAQQITDDVYDDLDPVLVSFPNRTGIIFSSNRPGSSVAASADSAVAGYYPFNIFLVDYLNKDFRQITQLTNVKFGDARYPMPYNVNHFTFVSNESGIANRWAGFFSTQRSGLDTVYWIGEELLRNPSIQELDSTLNAWQKQEPDSISYFQVYTDSTYTFPITNYESGLLESKVAGDRGQLTEVRREGDFKFVYKLRVDSIALRKRNVTARPTEYMRRLMRDARSRENISVVENKNVPPPTFQSEFENDQAAQRKQPLPTAENNKQPAQPYPLLKESKLFNYKLKFNTETVLSGITNNILVTRYQPYAGGSGPVQLNNGNDINWTFQVGIADIMEDIKIAGGFRFGTSLSDKDAFISFMNYRRRIDWGFTYYRSNIKNFYLYNSNNRDLHNNFITNLYQLNLAYPLNEVKSVRLNVAMREDKVVFRPYRNSPLMPYPGKLSLDDSIVRYSVAHLEYVHDNTLNPAQNIYTGLRYKVYFDYNFPISGTVSKGTTFNLGFDARHYLKIYRNFIWATRAAGDFSFGDRKIIYYLGGADGWINPKFYSENTPAPDQDYAFQSLTLNMRGFKQNIANGNNAVVINSELRFPIFATLINKPINNAFIRNFQVVQFFDLGTAWNGAYDKLSRPTVTYRAYKNGMIDPSNPVTLKVTAGGIGPFAGGYGFGVRSTLLGYFIKFDAAWQMNGVFRGTPMYYVALGLDF